MRPGFWVVAILLAILLLVGKMALPQESTDKENVSERSTFKQIRIITVLAAEDCYWLRPGSTIEELIRCTRDKLTELLAKDLPQ